MQVMLIDDEEDDRRVAAALLGHGVPAARIVEVGAADDYAEQLHQGPFDVAIAPLATAWGDGAALLAAVRRRHPGCATILLGGLPPETLAAVLGSGAVDAVLARSSRGLARLVPTVLEVSGAAPQTARADAAAPAAVAPADAQQSRELIAALCHDLQDPLQVILHSARRLAPGESGEPMPRELQRIVGNAERMQAMLDALAQGDALATSPPHMEPVDLDALLDQLLQDLGARGVVKDAEVRRTPLPVVTGDQEQLRRLLANLLGNALKFRGARPTSIAVQAIERPLEWLVSVADNGIGIAPQDAERAFSMFVRLHGPHEYPGSGVGLATCRRIARAHGGDIWVQSTPGGGATFILSLPRQEARDAEAPAR